MKLIRILIFTILVFLLSACSETVGPEQIAVFPIEEPIAVYPQPPETTVIYNATLDIEVSNVERATKRAKEVAFEQGGFLVSAQSWYRDGEKHTAVVLAVPYYRFDPTKDDLLRLGILTGEWISSEMVSSIRGSQDKYAHITVYLHPRESKVPEISLPKWRPVHTFERAFGVFVSIFGFLLDIVIWTVVVAGPFILIGWGIYRIYQWRRKAMAKINHEPES